MAGEGGGGFERREDARLNTPEARRKRALGKSADDPYLTAQTSTITRGQDTGMPTTKVAADASQFSLNEKRSKDARNWEYWYNKRYGGKPVEGTTSRWEGGKGGETVTRSKQQQAIDAARQDAKRDGQIQYEIDNLRAETKRLKDLTAYREEGSTPFSSQKAAMSLRASQARTRRGQARGLGLRRRSYSRVANLG